MNYLILTLVALAGIAIGMYLARRSNPHVNDLITEQAKQKSANKEKIIVFIHQHGKIQNNDVEKLVKVSNATAERYLNELEKEGILTQHGTIGQNVYYTASK